MWPQIKAFLWGRRVDILTSLILILVALAAFQMGRLSVFYTRASDFGITQTPNQ